MLEHQENQLFQPVVLFCCGVTGIRFHASTSLPVFIFVGRTAGYRFTGRPTKRRHHRIRRRDWIRRSARLQATNCARLPGNAICPYGLSRRRGWKRVATYIAGSPRLRLPVVDLQRRHLRRARHLRPGRVHRREEEARDRLQRRLGRRRDRSRRRRGARGVLPRRAEGRRRREGQRCRCRAMTAATGRVPPAPMSELHARHASGFAASRARAGSGARPRPTSSHPRRAPPPPPRACCRRPSDRSRSVSR